MPGQAGRAQRAAIVASVPGVLSGTNREQDRCPLGSAIPGKSSLSTLQPAETSYWVCLWFPHKGRVAHISLVFREMWDSADVDRQMHRVKRESEGKSSGIPHLAENERDMGHPSSVREPEAGPCGAEPISRVLTRH